MKNNHLAPRYAVPAYPIIIGSDYWVDYLEEGFGGFWCRVVEKQGHGYLVEDQRGMRYLVASQNLCNGLEEYHGQH